MTAVGLTPRVRAEYIRPASATQYAIGDLIGNSGTAALVVPVTFTPFQLRGPTGRISGGKVTLAAASGTIVLPAFDLVLFNPAANIPFAAGSYPADNDVCTLTAAAYIQAIGVLSFASTGWRNATGGSTASGGVIFQATSFATRPYANFNLSANPPATVSLIGILQAQSTWNPGAVVQTFDFELDVDQDPVI